MDKVSMILKMTREQQIQIEEHCLKHGLSFTEYFMKLHDSNMMPLKIRKEEDERVIEKEEIEISPSITFSSCETKEEPKNIAVESPVKRKPGRPSMKNN